MTLVPVGKELSSGQSLHILSFLVYASSEGSGQTVGMT